MLSNYKRTCTRYVILYLHKNTYYSLHKIKCQEKYESQDYKSAAELLDRISCELKDYAKFTEVA